jgi:hypothetical protein
VPAVKKGDGGDRGVEGGANWVRCGVVVVVKVEGVIYTRNII